MTKNEVQGTGFSDGKTTPYGTQQIRTFCPSKKRGRVIRKKVDSKDGGEKPLPSKKLSFHNRQMHDGIMNGISPQ